MESLGWLCCFKWRGQGWPMEKVPLEWRTGRGSWQCSHQGNSVPGQGDAQRPGNLACSRRSKEVRVARAERMRQKLESQSRVSWRVWKNSQDFF